MSALLGSREDVLVVDDDAMILRVVRRALGSYAVRGLEDGLAAAEAVFHDRPRLLLLDMWFPTTSGIAVLREVLRVRPGLPVVMLTGDHSLTTVRRAMDAGAQAYLTKPFAVDDLLHVVDHLLAPEPGPDRAADGCPWRHAPGPPPH